MKKLIDLCIRVRKLLTQAFKNGIEECYKRKHGVKCSRLQSYCRDLCFLPHLLDMKLSWKDISVQAFAISLNIEGTLLLHHEEAIQQLADIKDPLCLSEKFWKSCEKLMEHRLRIRKNLFVGIKQVSTWKVGGAAVQRLNNTDKLRVFKRFGAKGILCLQETRWSQSGDAAMQQRLNRMQAVHTPAAITNSGGLSGGVAILLPLGFGLIKHEVILAGRIHAALLQTRTVTFWVINCYIHPQEKKESLVTLCTWVSSGMVGEHQMIVCDQPTWVDPLEGL